MILNIGPIHTGNVGVVKYRSRAKGQQAYYDVSMLSKHDWANLDEHNI